MCDERLNVPDGLLALIERQVVDGGRERIESELGRHPANGLGARLEGIDTVSADLACDERFKRVAQSALRFAQVSVGQPLKRGRLPLMLASALASLAVMEDERARHMR
jgi:hypothetical protein